MPVKISRDEPSFLVNDRHYYAEIHFRDLNELPAHVAGITDVIEEYGGDLRTTEWDGWEVYSDFRYTLKASFYISEMATIVR